MSLGPEWLRHVVKRFARNGRARQAQAILDVMSKTVGDPTSDSSANRNTQRDPAHLNAAQGEIDLAAGRFEDAIRRFETAYQADPSADSLDSLATACLTAGRLGDAARHYEKLIAQRDLGSEPQEHWLQAHVRLAEIRERQGNPEAARALYEALLAIWKDADPDLPALKEAKDALARLK